MLLIKNVDVYSPEYIGKKDIFVCGERIEYMDDSIELSGLPVKVIDGTGKMCVPGLIDNHVHVTGGGGEGGFATRAPEMKLSEMIENGITTIVGLLGTDGVTRSVENLYAKTMSLWTEGVSAYMLTGSYDHPGPTVTGAPERDLVFLEKVLGLKLAVSDHRAPNVTVDELIQIASKMRVNGMLCGKEGFMTLHMGDGKRGLKPVFEALDQSDIPVKIFHPTHVNRNPHLMEEGYELLARGGFIDLTCGMDDQGKPLDCINEAKRRGLDASHITISSDGHGSWSTYDEKGSLTAIGIATMDALYNELKSMVKDGLPLSEALTYFTSNVADCLGIGKKKGRVESGMDADFLLLNDDLSIDTVVARGTVMMEQGILLKRGNFETC